MTERRLEDVVAKLVALGLWESLLGCNFAVKARGSAMPYFCLTLRGEQPAVKVRLLLLEGWRTVHDFLCLRHDRFCGFVSSPIELPHFELVVLADGSAHVFRHDLGYMPRTVAGASDEASRVARLLWEVYGVALRLETDPKLPLAYAGERSVFARVEGADGAWADAPLAIPDAAPAVERVTFDRGLLARAKDLPIVAGFALALDFRLLEHVVTRERRPRTVYALFAVDASSGEPLVNRRVSLGADGSLRDLWQEMPSQALAEIVRLGRVPGEVRLVSGRVFRLLRPLCLELPFKLSLHDSIPVLQKAMAQHSES